MLSGKGEGGTQKNLDGKVNGTIKSEMQQWKLLQQGCLLKMCWLLGLTHYMAKLLSTILPS